jgi:nucleoside-diphosphate-sugar epimerase
MRTVVVTGIAGTVGSRVADLLRADGVRVVGIDLPAALGSSAPGDIGTGSAEMVGLDLAGPDVAVVAPLAELVQGADAIVHLAWQIPEGPESRRRSHRVNEANRLSLDRVLAAASTAGVDHVVLVSSATVYGAWPDNPVPLSEDAPLRPNPAFAFAVGKAEAERAVTEWVQGHREVAVAVLRPAVTVGGIERPLYQALGATRAPRGADGSRPVQYLHVDDLAAAVLVVLAKRLGGVFNVAPDAGIREDTARALTGGLARVALPARLAGAVAAWSWDLWRSGIPKEALPYSLQPWVIASDRLRGEGWRPRYSSEEALVATDMRPHWDNLPPGRRQNYTMAAIAATVLLLAGLGVGGVIMWRRRRR